MQFNGTLSFCSTSNRTFPLNCCEEPFCNICERFEAERIFAVFTATSTRNCNFLRQVPGNCSDKELYFPPDYQGNTAFVLFDRDVCGNGIPVKNRCFLSEISVTHATWCRDNSPFRLRIKLRRDKQTTPILGRTQITIPFERETKKLRQGSVFTSLYRSLFYSISAPSFNLPKSSGWHFAENLQCSVVNTCERCYITRQYAIVMSICG